MSHPLHPFVVHFPLAFLLTATLVDWLALGMGESVWQFGSVLLVLGLLATLPAIISGLVQFSTLPDKVDVIRVANRHMALVGSAIVLYGIALVLRVQDYQFSGPSALAVACSSVGSFLLLWGGRLGAEMVYGFGIGVKRQS